MAENIGNLAVVMSLNAQQFNAGLRETATQIDQIQVDVTRMSATMNAAGNVVAASASKQSVGMRFLSGAMQQGSFAAQDFASQLSTRGLGGALQAASNNIQVMGSAFGPWGMAISAATGLAVQGLGTYLLMTQNAAKETQKAAKVTEDAWAKAAKSTSEQLASLRRSQAEFGAGLTMDRSTGFGGASVSDLEGGIQQADKRMAELQARREQVLRDFDTRIRNQYGDLTADQAPSEFFGLNVPGARATNVLKTLKGIGFGVSGETVGAVNNLDKELRDIDVQGQNLYREARARTEAIDNARQRERFKAESDSAAKRVQEEMRIAEESRNAVLGDIGTTSAIQRRRDALNRAFNNGSITQLEKTIGEQRIAFDEGQQRNAMTGPRAVSRNSDEVYAMMQRAIRGDMGASDKQESIKKNTADTATATKETAKAVKKLSDRPVVVVRF